MFKLSWNNQDELEWTEMSQKTKYPRRSVVAMYIPDYLATCHKKCSTIAPYDGNCCTPESSCEEDERICYTNNDCQDGLKCGKDNCPSGFNFPADANCCLPK